jgi:hypothetical protein
MASFQLAWQMAARLGDNLDATLDEPLLLPIGLENIERHVAKHGTNALNGFKNIRKA